jgi:uncharacterized integral membrane protein
MDNKLKRTLFQFVKEQMYGILLKEFIVKNTTKVLFDLLFMKSTFLEQPSTMSLRLLSSNKGSTL